MGKLDGRVAIVTGATRGLGCEIAKAFMSEGAKVATWVRGQEPERTSNTPDFIQHGMPVSNLIEARDFVDAAAQTSFDGRIDILVNCAGVYGPIGLLDEIDWAYWEDAIQTNLLLPAIMCRAVLPYMRKKGYGKIIQISGGGATKPTPNASAYAASKAGVVRFAETLAEELRGSGIDVNSMAPGALPTRIQQQIIEAGPERAGEEAYAKAQQATSLDEPEMAFKRATDLAVFLASADSDGITGKLISVWDKPLAGWENFPTNDGCFHTLRRVDSNLLDKFE